MGVVGETKVAVLVVGQNGRRTDVFFKHALADEDTLKNAVNFRLENKNGRRGRWQ
jgi:hypothetical protein